MSPNATEEPSSSEASEQSRDAGEESGDAAVSSRRRWLFWMIDYAGLVFVLIVLIAFFTVMGWYFDRDFLTRDRILLTANLVPPLSVVAVGMTLVLIVGGIDLSVGSVGALCGVVVGVLATRWNVPLPVSIVVGILAGGLIGTINGGVSVAWRIPSFIVTLAMLEAARGVALSLTDSRSVFIGAEIGWVAKPLPGVRISPAFVLAIMWVGFAQVVLERTVFGRYLIAIGTNEQAVRLSGIRPARYKIAVFAIAGASAGLAGWFRLGDSYTAAPNVGVGLELSAIAAVVIGGTSLMGGRGSVVASFLGVLIMAVLQGGLDSIGVPDPHKKIVTGAVIAVAVILDVYREKWFSALRGLPA